MDEHDDLTTSLLELASIVAGTATLEQTLSRIVGFAIELIRSADCGVLSLSDDGSHVDGSVVIVVTDTLADAADQARDAAGEGPAVTAVAEQGVVIAGALASDSRWPRFAGRVARLGINSALAVPLSLDGTRLGSMSLYARAPHAFAEADAQLALEYARPAAAVARNAHILARSEAQIRQLDEALRTRPVIDQAIGIIRLRTGKSEAEALSRLVEISHTEQRKVSEIAREIVDEAVRTANARRRISRR
jgi:GAF domain-containing protein